MIWATFKKDWLLLWPLAVLVTLIQVAFEWAFSFGDSPAADELLRLLTPAWYIGIVTVTIAVVQEDTLPGVDQDWLIRPVARTELLLAKVLFAVVMVSLPMLIVNFLDELLLGFPAAASFGDALYKEFYVFVCLLVPAMAAAAATRNLTELVVLGAGLVVLYVVSVWLSTTLGQIDRCPTCDTSLSWQQHLLQHIGIFIGSVAVLALQYYRRDTRASRWVLAVGVVLLVVVQVPWNVAFAIQTRMGPSIGSPPSAIGIGAGSAEVVLANPGKQDSSRRLTRALLQGDVDEAVQNLKGIRAPRNARAIVSVPLQVTGVTDDELLVVDRAELAVTDAQDAVLYRTAGSERKSVPLSLEGSQPSVALQKFELPGPVYARIKSRAARLRIDYSLTVRAVVAQHKLAAAGGEFRAPEIGWCQSEAGPKAASVRCRQIGRVANCYSASLYGPQGQHNPEVRYCESDYRPFIPSPLNIFSFASIDLPIRDAYGQAHYAVDGSDIAESYIILRVYEIGQHFRRTVIAPLQPTTLE